MQRANAKTKTKRKPGQAARASLARKDALCPHVGECGGCSSVDVAYDEQLRAKDAAVAQLFPAEEFPQAEVRPILGMADPFHYRDKVTSPFAPGKRGPNGGRAILSGMYAKGSHRIVDTSGCLLENERAHKVVQTVKSLMLKWGIAPYDEDRGSGFMRHAVVRVGHESGEVLVTLVTNADDFPRSKSFCRELVRRCPFVTTVVQNVNLRQTNVILGQKERVLYGPGFILDTLCALSFRISSQSFYQVNSKQTEVLYEQVMLMAGLSAGRGAGAAADDRGHLPSGTGAADGKPCREPVVVDAYCGTGTIGLVAASRGAGQVIGVDSVESSIRDARLNARHNGVQNAWFVTADAADFMRGIAEGTARYEPAENFPGIDSHVDVVLMDPPRAGASEAFLESAAALAPERIVYVSCNPATQVRDVRFLVKNGYTLEAVQPVDMFPHTDHVECVALLVRAR